MSKIALVTGGLGGLGTAMCKSLAQAGHKVITTYYTDGSDKFAEEAVAWEAKMKSEGFDFKAYPCDVANYESCEAAAALIKADFGSVDILVNNAGITRDGMFKKMGKDKWDAVISTNLSSAFNLTKQFLDDMVEKGWGRVINIASINGQKGQAGQTNYSAAKAGLHGFTMALAQEVCRKGVTVNTIAPGYAATDMVMAIAEEIRNKIIAGIPMGRLAKPEEIAGTVVYLASDVAGFMTGAQLAINGGQHMM